MRCIKKSAYVVGFVCSSARCATACNASDRNPWPPGNRLRGNIDPPVLQVGDAAGRVRQVGRMVQRESQPLHDALDGSVRERAASVARGKHEFSRRRSRCQAGSCRGRASIAAAPCLRGALPRASRSLHCDRRASSACSPTRASRASRGSFLLDRTAGSFSAEYSGLRCAASSAISRASRRLGASAPADRRPRPRGLQRAH